MPKPTFFNLPPEKREKIINAAVDEFAEYGLENASTNRIVENSGISKGSFYQYFEDKQDVFMYLLSVLEEEKMGYFRDKHPPSTNLDTFEYFRWVIKAGMEFNSAYPRMTQAVSRVLLGRRLVLWKELCQVPREDHACARDDDPASHRARRSGPQRGCGTGCHGHGYLVECHQPPTS